MRWCFPILALTTCFYPCLAQESFEYSKVDFIHGSLEHTQQEAEEKYQGDHLVFFFDDSSMSHLIEEDILGDDEVATFINANFATFAVALEDKEQAKKILSSYGGVGLRPRVVVSATRLNNLKVFISPPEGATREDMAKFYLDYLRAIKTAETFDEYKELTRL